MSRDSGIEGWLVEALRSCGIVDTHYHVGPELLPRRYDVVSLAEVARRWNATLVLKNHTYSTTPLASLARARYGARFLGSIVLNRFVGGLNPDAVSSALSGNRTQVSQPSQEEPPVVVWMPTVHAAAHLRVLGHSFDPRWSGGCCGHSHGTGHTEQQPEAPVEAFDASLRPRPGLVAVLEVMARSGARLATGHLSAEEIMRLVPLAIEIGVKRVIITHPHYPCVELSDAQLRRLARYPEVFIEHCFAIHTIEEVPLARIAESIRATGPDQVVLATDFGQIHSDPFPDGTVRYARELLQVLGRAVSREDLIAMFSTNGARALAYGETLERLGSGEVEPEGTQAGAQVRTG
jgi:hypothetical protein